MTKPINPDSHWRDSARPIKFFIWDGKAVFPMVLFLLYIRWWTFFLALFAMLFFSILNRFGFTPIVFFRRLRGWLTGPRKMAVPWWME